MHRVILIRQLPEKNLLFIIELQNIRPFTSFRVTRLYVYIIIGVMQK
jgi:hypothetical protein